MVQLSKDSTIYILAPANSSSGGQEALHQLGYYLNKQGFTAQMAYYLYNNTVTSPVVPKYEKYAVPYCFYNEIIDTKENLLICPEIATIFLHDFKEMKKAIWWLSVHFYTVGFRHSSIFYTVKDVLRGRIKEAIRKRQERKKIFNFNDPTIIHFTGSQYAYEYVKSRGANPSFLIEPLGLDFINKVVTHFNNSLLSIKEKKANILYNPVKKSRTMKLLMKKYPNFNYVALKDMTADQLIQTMKESMLYVDFGKFPGPERLPKEAVICGCCVITGTRGAAAFYEDVRIPSQYKIKRQNIDMIANLISDIITHYEDHISAFQDYRDMVLNLEENFIEMIQSNFKKR